MRSFIKFSMTAWDGPGTPKVSFEIVKNRKNFNFKNLIGKYISRSEIKNSKNENHGNYIAHMRCEQTPYNKSRLVFKDRNNSLEWAVKESRFYFIFKLFKKICFISLFK